jgi:hypothetical protein
VSKGLVEHRCVDRSGGESGEVPDPYQVVGRSSQCEDPADARLAAMAGLAQRGHGLEPAKHFFDALAPRLTQQVAGMPTGAPVDRAGRLLRHVRRDLIVAHKLLGIVTLVRSQGDTPKAWDLLDHPDRPRRSA